MYESNMLFPLRNTKLVQMKDQLNIYVTRNKVEYQS